MEHVYEVRCYDCEVSYPPERKRCFYCGGRTHAERPPGAGAPILRDSGRSVDEMPAVGGKSEQELVEEEMQGASPFRFGSTGIWIALALFAGAMRACFGS